MPIRPSAASFGHEVRRKRLGLVPLHARAAGSPPRRTPGPCGASRSCSVVGRRFTMEKYHVPRSFRPAHRAHRHEDCCRYVGDETCLRTRPARADAGRGTSRARLADLTAFLGLMRRPRPGKRAGSPSASTCSIVGFEFEYGKTAEDLVKAAPSLTTGMFNGLVMTPTGDTQLYLTAGGGFFRERLSDTDRDELRHEHRRRREDWVGRTAAPASGLPHLQPAPGGVQDAAAVLRGRQYRVLSATRRSLIGVKLMPPLMTGATFL